MGENFSTMANESHIGIEHLDFHANIGRGNFGKVVLAENKTSKQLYAIKMLKKRFIIDNNEVKNVWTEKRVFLLANKDKHPFILTFNACFDTEDRVYFVMPYVSGGDLGFHIQKGQFSFKQAQFYAAEVCLGVKYLHRNGIIHRNLKLDNILLTSEGHAKVADFIVCKENMWHESTTTTFCGTTEFMAPEMLRDKKYGRAVDWWSFGICLYQMLLQQSPFRGHDEDEIYDAILTGEPSYPDHLSPESVSILRGLLAKTPELRLGGGPTDAEQITGHAFFGEIDWDDVYHRRIPVPFVPQISSPTDTHNFDPELTDTPVALTPVDSVLSPAMQEEFRGFSYTAEFG